MVLIYRTKKLEIMQHESLSPPQFGNVKWKSTQNIPGTLKSERSVYQCCDIRSFGRAKDF